MTDKEKIKQEIERRIEQCYRILSQDLLEIERKETNCCLQQYKELLQFIDSIPEEYNEDLEEAANQHSKQVFHGLLVEDNITAFKAGAEWQKQRDQETIELAEDHAMLAGMNRMKEEMMKDAVYGYVSLCHDYPYRRSLVAIADGLINFEYAEKVKIIIIKEE